ncbi:MAG: hypothetical protein ACO1TE_11960 [Prosthecobacter sp.]
MKIIRLALVFVPCLLASCVLGRRTIDPTIPSALHPAAKGTVAIAAIQDLRVFQNKPSDPGTPSVKDDHNAMSAAAKTGVVGRQRNGFGKAMGDLGLPGTQNIQTKMRDLLAEAFARRGYTLAASSGNRASADVHKFWAWMTPGMWYLGFEAVIECKVTVSQDGSARTFVARGHGESGGQAAHTGNWNQVYEDAFGKLLADLDRQLQAAGF